MTATESRTSTDRIEKRVTIGVPRTRVWRALTQAQEFGAWFGVKLEREFAEGATVRGRITIKGYEDAQFEMFIERILPERLFSYRWHPYALDPKHDYSAEPTTLVEFRLEETEGGKGTQLTIIESGFDRLPESRRAEAFRMNDGGWTGQIKNIERYVTAG
jgi:uncharacterized protein YndB with AHSA1/START domain